ncbi:S1 family peptidase [Nocardia sp. NPDC048505]|uniref:S1 family peptidase n=1 Tax=unclassified Nocardia TaxID=2637762 RepID=UPI0033CC51A9
MASRRMVAAVLAAASIGVLGTAEVAADPAVALGGGSGIILNDESVCTVTTIGYDAAGRLVGLTAGHCAGAGSAVRAEQQPGAVIGTVAFSDRGQGLDFAVLEFDAGLVDPLRTVGGTTIAGTAPAPGFGGVVCSNGRTTGSDCGMVWGDIATNTLNQSCSLPGDSGGPVTVGDRLVGMNQGRYISIAGIRFDVPCRVQGNPIHSPAYFTAIDRILAAIDEMGGVGAGFRPI